MRSPRRPINPRFLQHIKSTGKPLAVLAAVAGFPFYATFYLVLRDPAVAVTPLMLSRLQRLAAVVEFPIDEIFLDEGGWS